MAWGIALVEYCLAVPANRWGNAVYSTAELKTMQEVITLLVFAGFSVLYLKEAITWNHAIGFALSRPERFSSFAGRSDARQVPALTAATPIAQRQR